MSDTTYITSLESLYADHSTLSPLADKVCILLRDGTSQEQRLVDALNPDYIKIDERTFKDLLLFFHQFAQHIRFYQPNFAADANWSNFFDLFDGLEQDKDGEKWRKVQKIIEQGGNISPHISLLIAFLHLFQHAQNHLNSLTERHLSNYFCDVLRFVEKPARPDHVHLIVSLAKSNYQTIIGDDVLFRAGTDANKNDIFYRVERETAINNAQVAQLKSLFIDRNENGIINKIYAIPKPNSKDGHGNEDLAPEQAFLPFHQGLYTPQSTEADIAQFEANIGFALASPILRLYEGKRTIAIEIQFGIQDTDPQHPNYAEQYAQMQQFWANTELVKSNFKVALSTDAGWLEKNIDNIALLSEEALLTLYIFLSPQDPPITPYQNAILQDNYPDGEPIIKISSISQFDLAFYEALHTYPIQNIRIAVAAERVGQLYLQSDLSPVENGKAFEPFGIQPRRRAAFYVSSPEAFNKHIEALSIDFTWKNLPENFADYYDQYPSLRNMPFKVALSFLHEQQWLPLTDQARNPQIYQLFKQNETESIKIDNLYLDLNRVATPLEPDAEAIPTLLNNNTRRGYLKIELVEPADAFGHAIYANLYADQLTDKLFKKSALMMSMAMPPSPSSDKDKNAKNAGEDEKNKHLQDLAAAADDIKIPNPPYSPQIEQLTLSYTASQSIHFNKPQKNKAQDAFFHLHPFGKVRIRPHKGIKLIPLYEEQGSLYIGIENLQTPQNISLLFQLAEGSGNPDLSIPSPQWHFLSHNQWLPFDRSDILSDTTNNLINTGIMVFKMSNLATQNNQIMPPNYHWLRLSIDKHLLALNQIIAIHAQALSAVLVEQGKDYNQHLKQPLAANTIKELVIDNADINEIKQPYSSFGGKTREQGNDFYARVSERLRHKNRAISIWDYERLVLERFNDIYKVKCLPHTSHKSDFSPGSVTLITIPNLRNKNAVNRLQPKTPLNLLMAIKQYISRYTSPFVHLDVQNPVYEEILVSFDVGFMKGYDIGLHVARLNEAIKQFLSPWAYEAQKDIIFGGRIHKSSIINFIEELNYVDYVNNFTMYHKYQQQHEIITAPKDEAEARSTRSILVSVEQHQINPLKPGELTYTIPEGIGHMLIEINFEVEDDE